jgi:hypothetical protein
LDDPNPLAIIIEFIREMMMTYHAYLMMTMQITSKEKLHMFNVTPTNTSIDI